MKPQATRNAAPPFLTAADQLLIMLVLFAFWAIGSSLEYESRTAKAEGNTAPAAQPGGTQHVQQAR